MDVDKMRQLRLKGGVEYYEAKEKLKKEIEQAEKLHSAIVRR